MKLSPNSLSLFTIGSVGYGLIELLWRGHTHWSMLLTGGSALLLLEKIDRLHQDEWMVLRCIRGAAAITGIELTVGLLVNKLLGLAVWDYSDLPLNLAGQICPLYSILWYLLCWPVYGILHKLRKVTAP